MKIHCVNPNHKDTNPSMQVYEDWCHCFVCDYRIPTEEVLNGEQIRFIKKEPENLTETLEYIRQLPILRIRGLYFPHSYRGYYIVWPDNSFYKLRLKEGTTRYVGPRGHKPGVFKYPGNDSILVLIEGEINCISLKESIPENIATLASPGSATEFTRYTSFCLRYSKIYIIVDKDIPGVVNGLKLKEELIKNKKWVKLIATEKDINQILQEEGKEGVRSWIKENLELP